MDGFWFWIWKPIAEVAFSIGVLALLFLVCFAWVVIDDLWKKRKRPTTPRD